MAKFKIDTYTSGRLICLLILTTCINRCVVGLISRSSPCPNVFKYEDTESGDDRWYGELTLRFNETIQGATIRITLDRPSHLLVSWAGNAITNDNRIYITNHDNAVLDEGITYKVRIMVKYDPTERIPLLDVIHFNGRRVCPADLPLTLIHGESSHVHQPPDLEFSEATDILSDIHSTSTHPPPFTPHSSSGGTTSQVKCGQTSTPTLLITNGQQTQPGQWPWHVALYKTEGINLNYICGGSLVSKNKIITAAHCLVSIPGNRVINSKSLVVYLGKFNLRQYSGEQGVQTKEVFRLNVHPAYNSSNFHNDIAVLTLSSDVQFTTFVRPICVWEPENNIHDIVGTEGVVTGWGLTEHEQASEELKSAKLPVVSTETCLRSYYKFYSEYTSDKSFCAGFRNGTSPCNGDSGGGLVFKRNSAWYLRGVVSLSVAREGLNFCDSRYYVIFSDVAKQDEFLSQNI